MGVYISRDPAGAGIQAKNYNIVTSFSAAEKIACIEAAVADQADWEMFDHAFDFLGRRFDTVVPMEEYNVLAEDLVTDDLAAAKVEKIRALCGDLRVPVFDPRLVFIKVNQKTRKLWQLYEQYSQNYDQRLAFLMAVWEVKPYLQPLPAGVWI